MMERIQSIFLDLYRCALNGEKAGKDIVLSGDNDWNALIRLSQIHHVVPMIYEALWNSPSVEKADPTLIKEFEEKAVSQTRQQARGTAEFLKLYQFLERKDLDPAVMKGIICRSLYPNPEQRYSTDEDLLVPENMFAKYHSAFLEYGLAVDCGDADITSTYEVSYHNKNVYIELHKSPFPPESEAYGELNRFFIGSLERTVTQTIYGITIRTLVYTDHLLYLLCHCYKHFLNCGCGIRLISDILLYSLEYCTEIDWEYIVKCCREAGVFDFCCAIYRIGEIYIIPGRFPGMLKKLWLSSQVDMEPLLKDILEGGVYGTSSLDRRHSSNITLNTMGLARGKNGFGVFNSIIFKTLFPSMRYMKQRYPYVKRFPFLLPAGWLQRIVEYGYDSIVYPKDGNRASEALRIGNKRVRLMKEYGILEEGKRKPSEETGLRGRLKKVYKKSHTSILAPLLSPVFLKICDLEYVIFNAKWFLQGARKPSKKDIRQVRENITFIFKSFERQKMAAGLCRNITRMYPGVRIVVADDSKEPLQVDLDNVKVIHLPFNSGIGPGLKAALAEVKTPYIVRLDDDELLTLRTMVHRELRYLHNHRELDIIGFGHMTAIRCRSPLINFREYYRQPMDYAPRPLKISHMTRIDRKHIVLGKVANIYLARTKKILEVGYNPNIRVIDHDDFFRRAAGKAVSAIALDTVVFHRHNPYDMSYRRYRSDYAKDMMYIRASVQKENTVDSQDREIL